MTPILTWLLLILLPALLATTLVLFHNFRHLTPLPLPAETGEDPDITAKPPLVSLLIPARNEERSIADAVSSACRQKYPHLEILVLDDNSTDRTAAEVHRIANRCHHPVRLLTGRPKPDNWLGKPWACHQLAEEASGEILLFIDADVTLEPEAVTGVICGMKRYRLDLLTLWPIQQTVTFWEKTTIPLIYHGLLTFLPSLYVWRRPRWMPRSIYRRTRQLFAAACGQFIAFDRTAYQTLDGHRSVRHRVVEDVALARRFRSQGYAIRMFHGRDGAFCRMYHNEPEIFEGLRKNFFASFDYRWGAFLATGLFTVAIWLLPFLAWFYAAASGDTTLLLLSSLAVILVLIQRLLIAFWYRLSPLYSFTHPLGTLWFIRLATRVMRDRITGARTYWKGRPV